MRRVAILVVLAACWLGLAPAASAADNGTYTAPGYQASVSTTAPILGSAFTVGLDGPVGLSVTLNVLNDNAAGAAFSQPRTGTGHSTTTAAVNYVHNAALSSGDVLIDSVATTTATRVIPASGRVQFQVTLQKQGVYSLEFRSPDGTLLARQVVTASVPAAAGTTPTTTLAATGASDLPIMGIAVGVLALGTLLLTARQVVRRRRNPRRAE